MYLCNTAWFHTNFNIVLSMSMKNAIGILIGIVLNLWMASGSMDIFFFYKFIYLFRLHWVFIAACGLSLVVASGGYSFFFFYFIFLFYFCFFFLAVLGLRFCARAVSSCVERGPLFIAVRGPLTIAASLVAEHGLQTRRLSSCGSRA